MGGGIKRIGSSGLRAQSINSPVANVPSRQGLLKINNLNTPNVSDWTEYTPTMTNLGNGTVTARYRRVGDSIDIICKVVAGSTTSATAVTFTLPSGLSPDLAKMANYNSGALGDVWTSNATYRDVGNNTRSIICRYEGSNEFRFVHFFANGTGAANAIVYDNSSLPQFNAGDIIIAWITNFPIQGWSANNNATIEEIVESSFFDLQSQNTSYVTPTAITGLTNNTLTDVPNSSLYLSSGLYEVTANGIGICSYSVAHTSASGLLAITDSLNNPIIGLVLTGLANETVTSSFRATIFWRYFVSFATATTIKLRVRLNTVGGTSTDRAFENLSLAARKIG